MEPDRLHDPKDGTNLDSQEYRTRLLVKLNCLIAVIEVALAKVSRSLEEPTANGERLERIKTNLENTLSICHRARRTLQRTIDGRCDSAEPLRRRMSYRDYVELSSIDEYRKFKMLPPISNTELASTDVDELLRKLSGH